MIHIQSYSLGKRRQVVTMRDDSLLFIVQVKGSADSRFWIYLRALVKLYMAILRQQLLITGRRLFR